MWPLTIIREAWTWMCWRMKYELRVQDIRLMNDFVWSDLGSPSGSVSVLRFSRVWFYCVLWHTLSCADGLANTRVCCQCWESSGDPHTHTRTHTHTHTHAHTHTCTHTHTRTLTHSHTHTQTQTHTHARTLTHTDTYTPTHTHSHTDTHTHTHVHARTLTYSHTDTHTHTHTHTNTVCLWYFPSCSLNALFSLWPFPLSFDLLTLLCFTLLYTSAGVHPVIVSEEMKHISVGFTLYQLSLIVHFTKKWQVARWHF